MPVYVVLALAIVSNALANILIKVGMMRVGSGEGLVRTILGGIREPAILGGVVMFGLALGAYSFVLSRMNLSIAYPVMTSLGFMLVILVSWIGLKESITLVQVLGFALIVAGVWLVAR